MRIHAIILLVGLTQGAFCEEKVAFAPQVVMHHLDELGSVTGWDFGLGARVLVPIRAFHIQFSGNYYFIDTPEGFSYDWNLLDFNIDFAYSIADLPVQPYVGGGLNVSRFTAPCQIEFCEPQSFETTDGSFAIVGGIRFPTNAEMMPFFEARYIFKTRFDEFATDRLVLSAGVFF